MTERVSVDACGGGRVSGKWHKNERRFSTLVEVVATIDYKFVQIHQNVHLKCIVCKVYLNMVNLNIKFYKIQVHC